MRGVDVFSVGDFSARMYSPHRFAVRAEYPLYNSSGSRRHPVQERLIELSVGETVQVGEYTVKVVAVDGDEIRFEVEEDGQDFVEKYPSEELEVVAF